MAIGAPASTPILKTQEKIVQLQEKSAETEEKDDNSQYLRRERSYGSFSRSFDISNIKSEEISGAYHDGVLTLTLPKKSPTAPSTSRRLDIQ